VTCNAGPLSCTRRRRGEVRVVDYVERDANPGKVPRDSQRRYVTPPMEQTASLSGLLEHWRDCGEEGLRELIPAIYKELRRLAHYHLQSERTDHTLETTALVHEVYLRLAGGPAVEPANRSRFIAVATRLMRQILVDYARARRATKRDGGCRVDWEDLAALPVRTEPELVALDEALTELSCIDERQAKIVEMKYFGGFSAPEISEALGISRATIDRDWATARVWLHRRISRTA
jgi:RNA polymerase sigma factor (TIGR02999 family)